MTTFLCKRCGLRHKCRQNIHDPNGYCYSYKPDDFCYSYKPDDIAKQIRCPHCNKQVIVWIRGQNILDAIDEVLQDELFIEKSKEAD